MKTILIFITIMLLFQIEGSLNAQKVQDNSSKLQNNDFVEVKEGNLKYIKFGSLEEGLSYSIERPETKDLKGKSYEFFYITNEEIHKEQFYTIVRLVFPEKRAKQLTDLRLSCIIIFNAVDNEILHVRFILTGKENENFPLKLSELLELEKRLKLEHNLITFNSNGKIIDNGQLISFPRIRFDSLYE